MNNQGIRNAWEEIHNQPYRAPDKVPDRVIDAPIPERVPERWKWLYVDPKGSDVLDLHFKQVLRELGTAEDAVARLEAEKQDARRIGLECALHLANETADWCIEEQEKGYLGAMRVADAIKRELSKPTAARQGEPS